jgi:hypothetical protein
MMTISCVLAIVAFGTAIASLMGKCPLTVPVLMLAIVEVLRCLPLR